MRKKEAERNQPETPVRFNRRRFLSGMSAAAIAAAGLGADSGQSAQAQIAKRKEQRMTRFGIQIEPQFGFSYNEVADLAKEAERIGFDAMWVSDHLFWDAHSEQRNCMDAWTLLTAFTAFVLRP